MNKKSKFSLALLTVLPLALSASLLDNPARAEEGDGLQRSFTPVLESSKPEAVPEAAHEDEGPPKSYEALPPFEDVCQYRQSLMVRYCKINGVRRELNKEYPSNTEEQLKWIAEQICTLSHNAQLRKGTFLRELTCKAGDKGCNAKDVNFDDRIRRGTHSKTHGCFRGEFTVEKPENVDQKYKHLLVGFFAKPRKDPYPVWCRSAQGNSGVHSDKKPDASSMSCKLIGVEGAKLNPGGDKPGSTFDLVMNDVPNFFLKSPTEFLDFFKVVTGPTTSDDVDEVKKRILKFIVGGGRGDEASALFQIYEKAPKNILQKSFYSGTPYSWGKNQAVKYGMFPVPCAGEQDVPSNPVADNPGDNYLREGLERQLHHDKKPACFDFRVQPQTDPWDDPIEDPTFTWKGPFVTLGHMRIPPQPIDDKGKLEFCDNLFVSNFAVTPEFRPLGGMNLTRKWADYCSATGRLDFNHQKKNAILTGYELFGAELEGIEE
jgi:hypothetical protein